MSASKFTQSRRTLIFEVLRAGGSRAEAARTAQIDPSNLSRWLRRGEAHPEGRWGTFRREVLEVEAGAHAPRALHPVETTDPELAWRFLERTGEFDRD